jgi:hypothetical protein
MEKGAVRNSSRFQGSGRSGKLASGGTDATKD